jgi:hypothetical protein
LSKPVRSLPPKLTDYKTYNPFPHLHGQRGRKKRV